MHSGNVTALILGALLAGAVRVVLDVRGEVKVLRGAVLAMREDLVRLSHLLSRNLVADLDFNHPWLTMPGWRDLREPLARGLSAHEWKAVRDVVAYADMCSEMGRRRANARTELDRTSLLIDSMQWNDAALEAVQTAMEVLDARVQRTWRSAPARALTATRALAGHRAS